MSSVQQTINAVSGAHQAVSGALGSRITRHLEFGALVGGAAAFVVVYLLNVPTDSAIGWVLAGVVIGAVLWALVFPALGLAFLAL